MKKLLVLLTLSLMACTPKVIVKTEPCKVVEPVKSVKTPYLCSPFSRRAVMCEFYDGGFFDIVTCRCSNDLIW